MIKLKILILTSLLIFLATSCLPVNTPYRLNTIESGETVTENQSFPQPSFSYSQNYFQESSKTYPQELLLSSNFSDSFLMRGLEISSLLQNNQELTSLCLVQKFIHQDQVKFLIMTAKTRSHIDLIQKTQEYYLQIMPSDESINKQCATLEAKLSLDHATFYYAISSLCPECSSSLTSSSSRFYTLSGEEETKISVSHLKLSIGKATQQLSGSCLENVTCESQGYSCCLNSVCVRDGAVRPGASSLPGYESASLEVLNDPLKKILYPQFFYLCDSKPLSTSDGSSVSSTIESSDPLYEAKIRSLELKQLYHCLNLVDEEFSYCTSKFEKAHLSSSVFSAAHLGRNDDINFSFINKSFLAAPYDQNIVEVFFDGDYLYQYDFKLRKIEKNLEGGEFIADTANDSLTTSQEFKLLKKNISRDGNLYLTYKIDGTCKKVSTSKIECTKTYIQGHDDPLSTYYHDTSKVFQLPKYAHLSTSQLVKVKVNGINIVESSSTWSRNISSQQIRFSSTYPIYPGQKIEITYSSSDSSVISSKQEAQAMVNSICGCGETESCNLIPDGSNQSIENFKCSSGASATYTPPANQSVVLSARHVPHRFFDVNGVANDEKIAGELDQELTRFEYIENDFLRPNNKDQYVGFNEIYGTLEEKSKYSAKRAKVARIKQGIYYDIIVDNFNFSSCSTCGQDYYSSLQKIFPQAFSSYGGGYTPDPYETRKLSNASLYRADDLIFGRACFLPVTMIPWSHGQGSSVTEQRRNRLATQHFLFANGYQRDWFGFDYGSVIGSFDGVQWFSIGTRRRIYSKSEKLFLAVNTYIGDLNTPSEFSVRISESTDFNSDIPTKDSQTTGAECQAFHLCETDKDCFTQLGYDYSCQSITNLSTSAPIFNKLAQEEIGSSLKKIISLVGASPSKRCVYRGRGAPCAQENSTNNNNYSSQDGTLLCSTNHSCIDLSKSSFNDRMARYPYPPDVQNESLSTSEQGDTIGLSARIITRPYDFFGKKSAPQNVQDQLQQNNVRSLCVPGRDPQILDDSPQGKTTYDLQKHFLNKADPISGIGVTSSERSLSSYYFCPALDEKGNALHFQNVNLVGNGSPLLSQNLSTKLLDDPLLDGVELFIDSAANQVGILRNSCLRSAGATCLTDLDCGPSEFISDRLQFSDLSTLLNEAEINFWSEPLICGNPEMKISYTGENNEDYKTTENRCCRETEKTFTVYTQDENSSHKWCLGENVSLVAGVNTSFTDSSRYSRAQSIAGDFTCNLSNTSVPFALSLQALSSVDRWIQIQKQYDTLNKVNEKMCCSTHWVRNFAEDNGGGHTFSSGKMQSIDKTMFKHIQWNALDSVKIIEYCNSIHDEFSDQALCLINFWSNPFTCPLDSLGSEACKIISLEEDSDEEKKYLDWAASLELIGIPQVAIKANIYKKVNDEQTSVKFTPLIDSNGENITQFPLTPDFMATDPYYSGTNEDGLNLNKNNHKKVFSDKDFSCCLPSGKPYPTSTSSLQCCTGSSRVAGGARLCCLPDYADVSVYLNRYVSSEGRGLEDEDYDPATGYIKDKNKVMSLAQEQNLCCSNRYAFGVAISKLPVPLDDGDYITNNEDALVRRFTYINGEIDDNEATGNIGMKFNLGQRWNHHVYCVP